LGVLGLVPGFCIRIFAEEFGGNGADRGTERLGISGAGVCPPQRLTFSADTSPGQLTDYS
jgi:hypothetical protein